MIEIYRKNTNALTFNNLKNYLTGELISQAAITFDIRDAGGTTVYSGSMIAGAAAGEFRGIIPETVDLPRSEYDIELEADAGAEQVLSYSEKLIVRDRQADVF